MGNFNYGKTLSQWGERLSYNKEKIVELLKKHYENTKNVVTPNGYYSKLDGMLLLSILDEYKPNNIVEIGGGLTTKLIMSHIQKNKPETNFTTFAIDLRNTLPTEKPKNFKYIEGDFLNTYFENDIDWSNVDLLFIDALHEAHFATFFCYELFPKLKKGAIIHVHDFQEPSVLLEGYNKGYITLGEYWKNPTITDEAYEIFYYIKDKPEYRVLCNSNNLLELNTKLVDWIPNVTDSLYINCNGTRLAPAESLWIIKE
jgi:predicted O-methyltransferase YrrM